MANAVRFEGVYPLLVTPFDDRENVDLESFARAVSIEAEFGAEAVLRLPGRHGPRRRRSRTAIPAAARAAIPAYWAGVKPR